MKNISKKKRRCLLQVMVLTCFYVLVNANALAASLTVEDIQFSVYDSKHSTLIDKPTNPYGNYMDLFIAVKIQQSVDTDSQFIIKLRGFGKGRENGAEGVVEDYSVQLEKNMNIYGKSSRYFPFIVDYPCTDMAHFIIEVWIDKHKITTTKAESLAGCILY